MPVFSRALEKTLRRALAIANERRHEFATLEHLLLALIDDPDAAAVMRACNVDLDSLAQERRPLRRHRIAQPRHRERRGGQGDRRLPARRAARRHPRAVLRPRRSDRRQCAGRDLRRAREPRRLFPARAGHDALRRGQLHQPRHRQAPRPHRPLAHRRAASTRKPRRARRKRPRRTASPRKRKARSTLIASTSTRRRRTAGSIR